ncbi:hypothetical protein FOMPIDRAFT_92349 [Fomitopsis schrenkii]|uniref:Uncharacterized protein n=1 Tax=Fomitopsis schrenkii TaxID=2126942 RepID=S8DR25_FOMSC|nr:hypothetical protein FOMPIDRAFT_92349 [Fomitopsis schrenkii]
MSLDLQPALMLQEQDVCGYSNLFFSGLRMIAARPASVIVGQSAPSPIEYESAKAAGKRPADYRNGSRPHQERSHTRPTHPRVDTDSHTLDRRVYTPHNEHSTSSRHADRRHARAKPRRDGLPPSSSSSASDRPVSRDSDRASIASSHNDIEYITAPLNSFLSFNGDVSPTESTISLVSPRRERRPSLESTTTVPLPRKRTSRADKRRSVMSVDRLPSIPAVESGWEDTAPAARSNVRGPRTSMSGWADEVFRDWRQRMDSTQDDRSFLITT